MDLFHDHQNFPGELLPGDGAEEAALDLAEPVIVESQVIFEKQGLIVLRDLFSNGGQRVTKRITFTPTDQDIRIRDTMHEFDIMTSLGGHPNILQCYGMAQFDICCDLYIEAADMSLSGALQTLTFHKKWSYLSDICAGLAAIHQSGVIHFDLKCDNVLLVGNRAKIADFGVSLTVAQVQHPGFHPGLRGTANFLAPEIIREGATAWGFHCDLWSLGALIYELFHNTIPFHKWDMEAILFFTGRYFAFCDENPINPEVVPHQIAGLIRGLTQILPQSRVQLHQVQAVLQSLAW